MGDRYPAWLDESAATQGGVDVFALGPYARDSAPQRVLVDLVNIQNMFFEAEELHEPTSLVLIGDADAGHAHLRCEDLGMIPGGDEQVHTADDGLLRQAIALRREYVASVPMRHRCSNLLNERDVCVLPEQLGKGHDAGVVLCHAAVEHPRQSAHVRPLAFMWVRVPGIPPLARREANSDIPQDEVGPKHVSEVTLESGHGVVKGRVRDDLDALCGDTELNQVIAGDLFPHTDGVHGTQDRTAEGVTPPASERAGRRCVKDRRLPQSLCEPDVEQVPVFVTGIEVADVGSARGRYDEVGIFVGADDPPSDPL